MSLIVEDIKLKKNNTQILKGISCEFKSGIINGVIGVNGSGKRYELNCRRYKIKKE